MIVEFSALYLQNVCVDFGFLFESLHLSSSVDEKAHICYFPARLMVLWLVYLDNNCPYHKEIEINDLQIRYLWDNIHNIRRMHLQAKSWSSDAVSEYLPCISSTQN